MGELVSWKSDDHLHQLIVPQQLRSSEEFLVNQKMKKCLLEANINPYSIEGRADIYCRFILEYPDKLKVGHSFLSIGCGGKL